MSHEDEHFQAHVRVGIGFIVAAASLSCFAVTTLLIFILYSAVRVTNGARRSWTVDTHVHVYFLNLLFSDLLQSIGGILSIKWLLEAKVTTGMECTTQAVFKQMGDVGVALTSLVIAIHTFLVLALGIRSPPNRAFIVIAFVWTFIGCIVGIGSTHHKTPYYGDTGYWCWITDKYPIQRIVLEYLWLWIATFGNILIYVLLALVIKGFIIIDGRSISLSWGVERKERRVFENSKGEKVAMQLLFYPVVYVVCVIPLSIVRWMGFSGNHVPFAATAFGSVLFSLSGVFNVILFRLTRPKLIPSKSQSVHTTGLTLEFGMASNISEPVQTQGRMRSNDFLVEDPEDWKYWRNSSPGPWIVAPPPDSSSHHLPAKPSSIFTVAS